MQRMLKWIVFSLVLMFGLAAAAPQETPGRCDAATFIADMTVTDGSILLPGQAFTKTWRLKNSGYCTWTSSYKLVFYQGDKMEASSPIPLPQSVAPGASIDLSVPMKAPAATGHYRGYWLLQNPGGRNFGLGASATEPFWVDLSVNPALATAYDFTRDLCAATWRSGAGILPCPSTEGDWRGYAIKQGAPRLEDGLSDSLPGILVYPQNKYNGYIQGTYPEFTVQPGDRFQAIVGCDYGKACYVTYRLDYTINGATQIFWQWSEKNEGKTYRVDKDLSYLAGKKVQFTLTLLAAGYATDDRAIWGQPRIVRTGGSATPPPGSSPTPSATPIGPTATPPPANPPGVVYDFAVNTCAASWKSAAGTLPCPGKEGDLAGFAYRVDSPQLESGAIDSQAAGILLAPQNKVDGYIQGTYPEIAVQQGDHFQGIVNCAYAAPCYLTFRLDYQVGNGAVTTLWSWRERNEGLFYFMDKDVSALAGQKVKFILTILATGDASGDRALWSQPRLVRPGFLPTASATPLLPPTVTPGPALVTDVKVSVSKPGQVFCQGPNVVDFTGTITTSGATTVTYHWELGGDKSSTTSDERIVFEQAGTQTINPGAYKVDCGNYWVSLVVTSPNSMSARADYAVFPSTPTPTATPGAYLGPFAVILVGAGDVLNVRSGPSTEYAILEGLAPDATGIMTTGQTAQAAGSTWVEIRRSAGGTGWVNAAYLTEQVSPSAFCADPRVTALIEQKLKPAMLSSDGALFAAAVSPTHGLDLRYWSYGSVVHLSPAQAGQAFSSPTSYSWGGGPSGLDTTGTFAQVFQPRMQEVFNSSYQYACNNPVFTSSIAEPWPSTYRNINYYAVYKPGTPGIELDYQNFLVGIEFVNGQPALFAMTHFQWEP